MSKIIRYEHINNSHAKKEMPKGVVRKIYSEKKEATYKLKKKRERMHDKSISWPKAKQLTA